jgi:hypothetical protein
MAAYIINLRKSFHGLALSDKTISSVFKYDAARRHPKR